MKSLRLRLHGTGSARTWLGRSIPAVSSPLSWIIASVHLKKGDSIMLCMPVINGDELTDGICFYLLFRNWNWFLFLFLVTHLLDLAWFRFVCQRHCLVLIRGIAHLRSIGGQFPLERLSIGRDFFYLLEKVSVEINGGVIAVNRNYKLFFYWRRTSSVWSFDHCDWSEILSQGFLPEAPCLPFDPSCHCPRRQSPL